MKHFHEMKLYAWQFWLFLGENFAALKSTIPLSVSLSFIGTAIMALFDGLQFWFVQNIDYIAIVLIMIAGDWLLGSWVHWRIKKDFSWLKNIGGYGLKLALVVVMGLLFEALSHIVKDESLVYTYLKLTGRLIVLFYPFRSACINSSVITGGKFPPVAWINRITGFENDLSLDNFKNNQNNG